jgi:hypothetical protein
VSDLSAYLGDQVLDWLKGTTFDAAPADVYAALYNGDPAGAGTEVTGTVNLTRQAISFGAIAARAMSNNADIAFGTANSGATATYFAIFDASSGGNLLFSKSIGSNSISNGQVVKVTSGDLDLTY